MVLCLLMRRSQTWGSSNERVDRSRPPFIFWWPLFVLAVHPRASRQLPGLSGVSWGEPCCGRTDSALVAEMRLASCEVRFAHTAYCADDEAVAMETGCRCAGRGRGCVPRGTVIPAPTSARQGTGWPQGHGVPVRRSGLPTCSTSVVNSLAEPMPYGRAVLQACGG